MNERPKAKAAAVISTFEKTWESLFSSPVHLDSALSKVSGSVKSILAQIIPSILLRPTSQAEILGVGVPEGEPWSLDAYKLAQWKPAYFLAERMYEMMSQRIPEAEATAEDFPSWMVSEWKKDWGSEGASELVSILAKEAPLSLRVSRKTDAKSFLDRLVREAQLPVKAGLSNLSPLGVRLLGYAPVLGTDLYKNGLFEIQDEGSQVMALFALWPELYGSLLQERPGISKGGKILIPPVPLETKVLTVVDTCAGAGGKSLAMADALKGKGRLYAYDTSPKKLQALSRRMTRAGLNNIQTVSVQDGKETDVVNRFKGKADVVLVDAPCSGWGVLRRNPDIKWRQSQDVLLRMPEIQARLISSYSGLVAPGGRLVYGVCTFRSEETRVIVDQFLKKHSEFVATEGGFLGPGPCDGFFMQSFKRKE